VRPPAEARWAEEAARALSAGPDGFTGDGASARVSDAVAPVCAVGLDSDRGQNAQSAMQSNSATPSDSIPGRMTTRNLALELSEPMP